MAYPTHLAATLSGATVRQLAYWRRPSPAGPAVLVPELVRAQGHWLYSFRDVMALRTFVFLREDVSLQKLRKAVAGLVHLGNTDHLSKYSIVVDGDSVAFHEGDGVLVDLVESPGRQRLPMSDVLATFRTASGMNVVDLRHPREHLDVNPGTHGGYPVISGTRVEFDLVASMLADGLPAGQIGALYPSVSAQAALDALDFYRQVEQVRVA